MTPYYDEDGITIYHGDCREVLPSVSPDADPPYGARVAAWDAELPEWLDEIAVAPVAAIYPGVMNLGRMGQHLGRLRYRWTLCARMALPAQSPFGLCHWIPCMVYADDDVKLGRQDVDTRSFPAKHDQPAGHPSPKPLEAVRWVVSMMPSGVVADPFMGSGTTLRAAKDLGRRAIGVEVDERYCEIAAKRLAQGVLDFGASA